MSEKMSLLEFEQMGFVKAGYFHAIVINQNARIRYYSRNIFHPHKIDFKRIELFVDGTKLELNINSKEELQQLLNLLGVS